MSRPLQYLATAPAAPAVGLLGMGSALLAIRLGLLSPLAGLGVFVVGWLGGGLLGVVAGLAAVWRADPGAATAGWVAVGSGALLLAGLLPVLPSLSAPPIHDVATDLEDPPRFRAAARLPANRGRDMSHPIGGEEIPSRQRAAYPDLSSSHVQAPPESVFDAVLDDVAPELGWNVTWSHRGEGIIEAEAATRLFRFVDDVVVRIRPADGGSLVDVRSASRVGRSDLGANAARIRRFQRALTDRLAGS